MSKPIETIMKKFIKYPNQGLDAKTMEMLMLEMLNSIYHTFALGTIEEYEDEWGNFGEAGSTESLFLAFQEIYNYEINARAKISVIEEYALLMLLEYNVLSHTIPNTKGDLSYLIGRLKIEYRFCTDASFRGDLLTAPYPVNEYQKLIIDWLLQLRDTILAESELTTKTQISNYGQSYFFPHGISLN